MFTFKISIRITLLLFVILFIIHKIFLKRSKNIIEKMLVNNYKIVVDKCQHIDQLQDFSFTDCSVETLSNQCDKDPTCNSFQRKNDGSACFTSKLKESELASDGSNWYTCPEGYASYFKPTSSVQNNQSVSNTISNTNKNTPNTPNTPNTQNTLLDKRQNILNTFQDIQKKTAEKINNLGIASPDMIHKKDIDTCSHNTIGFDDFEKGLGDHVNSLLKSSGKKYISLTTHIKQHLKDNPSAKLSDYIKAIAEYVNKRLPSNSKQFDTLINHLDNNLTETKQSLSDYIATIKDY